MTLDGASAPSAASSAARTAEQEQLVVALSRFEVRNEKDDEVHAAFLERPGHVDSVPGFVRMEVLRGIENPKQFWLLTYWRSEEAFRSWHRGHAYKASHEGMPKGLKLVRGAQRIDVARRIAE